MPKLFYSDAEKAERERLFYNKDGSPKIQSVSDRDRQRLKGDLKHTTILQAKYQAIIALNSEIQNNFDEHYLPVYHQGGHFRNDLSRQTENELIINPMAELNFNVKVFNEAIQQRDVFLEKLSVISEARLARMKALTKSDKEVHALYQEILKRQAALQRTADEEKALQAQQKAVRKKDSDARDKAQDDFEYAIEKKSQVISSIEEHLKQNKQDIDDLNEKIKEMNKRAEALQREQIVAAKVGSTNNSTGKIFNVLNAHRFKD